MRNFLLVLMMAGLGWAVYEVHLKPKPVAAKPASPQETVASKLSGGGMTADALAAMEAAHPGQTASKLRNKLLTLSGQIVDLRVTGMQQDTAELVLATSWPRKVRLEVDLNKYERIRNVRKTSSRYEVVDGELIRTDPQSRAISVVFRVGQQVTQRARFVNVGARDLIFAAE